MALGNDLVGSGDPYDPRNYPDPNLVGPPRELMGQQPQQMQQVQQGPPAPVPVGSPEHAANKSKWQQFLGQMDDPNFRQAVMQTGLQLMKSPQRGQSGWDVASNALSTGVSTLQGLREHDRQIALQTADRAKAESQRQTTNALEARKVGTGEQNAAIYGQQVAGQVGAEKATASRGERQLTEAQRSNMSEEQIKRYEAETKRLHEKNLAAGTGGKTPADIQKINMLAAQYISQGMDDVAAHAKAVEDLSLAAKAKTPGEHARLLYQTKIQAYANSIEGMKHPIDANKAATLMDESIHEAMQFQQLDKSGRGAGIPTTATTGPIQRTNPDTVKNIEAAKVRKLPPDQIRSAIAAGGEDPTLYGY